MYGMAIFSALGVRVSENHMSGEKILIVDDEEDILELVAYNLEREGYQTIKAASGEEALKKNRSETPDLIILDLMLPGMDGLTVMKTLKEDESVENEIRQAIDEVAKELGITD